MNNGIFGKILIVILFWWVLIFIAAVKFIIHKKDNKKWRV